MKYQVKEVCLVKGRVRGTNETVELTEAEAAAINAGNRFPLLAPATPPASPTAPTEVKPNRR